MHKQNCYLGLGSNLENPSKQLRHAICHLSALPQTEFIRSAPWYVTKAWGVTNQGDFVNTAVHIKTALTPMALLKHIKTIEYRLMHRQPNKKWHARNIDIDILLFGKLQYHRQQLTIPHPLLDQRCFVIAPLMHLSPVMPAQLKQQLQIHQKNHNCMDSMKTVSPQNHTNGVKMRLK